MNWRNAVVLTGAILSLQACDVSFNDASKQASTTTQQPAPEPAPAVAAASAPEPAVAAASAPADAIAQQPPSEEATTNEMGAAPAVAAGTAAPTELGQFLQQNPPVASR